jgi:hypothetical protein
MKTDLCELKGFLPFLVDRDRDGHTLAWCDFGGVTLTAPFFFNEVMQRGFMPNPRFISTPVDVLLYAEEVFAGLKPNGFIFHMSACGSTLLTNMLRALDRNIALGEPNVLHNVLALSRSEPAYDVVKLFKGCVSALGQRRLGIEENYVIKFGSPITVFQPIITRAFPDVPCVFLYRDPVEVLVSNMANPFQQWLFEPEVTGCDMTTMTEVNTALENCAAALRRTSRAFLDSIPEKHLIANYSQFSRALLERVLDFFGTPASTSEIDRMWSAGKGHSHHPGTAFEPDSQKKQRSASPKLRAVADQYLGELYQELESMRDEL